VILLTEGDEHQRDSAALHGCLENPRYYDVSPLKDNFSSSLLALKATFSLSNEADHGYIRELHA
jgi:hypothetical protein